MAAGARSGALVLESLDTARKRGARILAEVAGYGASADANRPTQLAPDGGGAQRSMKKAPKRAGLNPDQIDDVNAHGTSTEVNDSNETAAIKRVFGDHAYKGVGQQHQEHDGPPDWRRRRGGGGVQRAGRGTPRGAAHHQPAEPGPAV